MKVIQLPFVEALKKSLKSKPSLIQVIVGPRQVGKTSGIKLFLDGCKRPYFYVSADGDLSKGPEWFFEQWNLAKAEDPECLLVVDEIQKVENWSEMVKKLWDEQKSLKKKLQVVVLGSSSLSIQKGLSESLAGRYFLHKVWHWNFNESEKAYGINFEQFLVYGGYPGSYPMIKHKEQWLSYIQESIVNAVIGKDILSQVRVKSPALFKQCFDLICAYPAQEISYTKLLGQLQDKGNTDLIKNYIEHFEGAFLLKQLYKFSNKKTLQRSSSPKLLPLCPALYSITLDAELNSEEKGRAFEVIVGMALLRKPGKLFYWRERNFEVDYVYQFGKLIYGLEVKSGRKKSSKGLLKFKEKFPMAETLILTPDNYEKALREI